MIPPTGGALHLSTLVRRSAAARAARAGDEVVLLNLERGVYFTLNETGAQIWETIGEGAEAVALRDALLTDFAVHPDDAWEDLVALLAELESEGLIELG